MYREREPREYHGAIVDLTDRCNLRCRHCFYFRNERDSRELPGEELLQGDGLGEQRRRPQPRGALLVLRSRGAAGDDHDRRLARRAVEGADSLEDLEAVAPRQNQVEENQVRRIPGRQGEGFLAVEGGRHPIALPLEGLGEDLTEVAVVVDADRL